MCEIECSGRSISGSGAERLKLALVAALFATATLGQAGDAWQESLDKVVRGVVVLRVNSPRAFDGLSPGYATATGFVVDAEEGLILTNRHVVTTGPVVAEAVLLDNEEVPVQALYRDPVHDFGFFRFDPEDVQFMNVHELELAPELARVGREIRVVGNDAGEKLAILPGTIARLDREAPDYGPESWNDFNTFYIQAASGTSGGSSGSPVVDIDGKVVAMNAAGKRAAASSFFLPLDRVKRALELLRAGKKVPRGTLQTVFTYQPYDEVRRLGVRRETESAARSAFVEGTGMIVVSEVVPQGPAAGILDPGDVVVRIDEKMVGGFIDLEEVFDDSVGEVVVLDVERGGESLRLQVEVADLHALIPSEYVEVGGAVLNPLSYHMARNFSVPAQGVYLASSGFMFSRARLPAGSLITEVNGVPTPTLGDFEREMASYPEHARVPIRFHLLNNPRMPGVGVVRAGRRWFSMQHCARDDATGRWPCEASPDSPPVIAQKPATTNMEAVGSRAVRALAPSLVLVTNDIPYLIDGVHHDRFLGTGLVVDAEMGLVVVDRETVPVALGQLSLTFGASVEVPGEVVYLHPEHNFAVVRYRPELLGDSPVRSARFRDDEIAAGDETWLVGLSGEQQVVSRETRVARRAPVSFPPPFPPRFRDSNVELVMLEDTTPTVGGVLADSKGRVQALWASFAVGEGAASEAFFAGIPARPIREIVDVLRRGESVGWRSLGVEFKPLTLADARSRGLSGDQASRLESHDPEGKRVLSVLRVTAGSPSEEFLRGGDLLLSVEGKPVTRFHEVEAASMREEVELQVLREGEELQLTVPTEFLSGEGTDRGVLWAGTLLQKPPPALARDHALPREGVYISRYWFGSPANRYGLRATSRIVEVNGMPTPDLDRFLGAVADTRDRGSVRLKVLDLEGRVRVKTLKLDLEYWPTWELFRGRTGWERRRISNPPRPVAPN
jgi:S1-C subfamily serine protease